MKIKDVHFDGEPDRFGQSIQRESLLNKWHGEEYIKHVYKLVHKAKDMDELVELVLSDEYMKGTDSYAVISKHNKGHWYRIREMFGDKQFKTYSDAGSVKVGTGDFHFLINNARGDGETRIAIFNEEDAFNSDMMTFETIIDGHGFFIYSYDCGNTVAETLYGKYAVYSYDGFVAFVKIKREM